MPTLCSRLLSFTFAVTLANSFAQIISTFDTGAEGWTAIDNLTGPLPTYVATGGNPGGFIQVVDGVGGTATYFVAPAKFLGDRSASFGQLLQFDLQVSVTANSSTAGVRLTGGGLVLVKLLTPEFSLPVTAPNWSSFSFRLDESVAWRVTSTTGPLATNAQIQTVLASLTELAINGEYSTAAADGGGLDNVVLGEANAPEIIVYNAVSANGDERNEILLLQFIDSNPLTQQNRVTIYNRWGDLVFETTDYDNQTRAFRGLNTNGDELPSGTYFYKLEFTSGQPMKTGYLSLKR
ncbi:MAG TPA: gliding motility-associated C-terminal domain-containing protein [Cyclobacteriaceae bacterium]|nr:gliding motility-associated C-terminal domain-containing protein [Cyclobacteriaceae bacterium]HRJ80885.1 gliding motility-associated C-terminal domain-containing protein [Cyclobacteriaceae bacterium]